ncbi:RNA binding [Striga asiatica]|uniref:RNA binding n=1 Tax=Striga asiatica TaxID=4170 RepID=A0A5A7QDS8_STRAF|nr:RNA binding [Striga asiatica]
MHPPFVHSVSTISGPPFVRRATAISGRSSSAVPLYTSTSSLSCARRSSAAPLPSQSRRWSVTLPPSQVGRWSVAHPPQTHTQPRRRRTAPSAALGSVCRHQTAAVEGAFAVWATRPQEGYGPWAVWIYLGIGFCVKFHPMNGAQWAIGVYLNNRNFNT